MKTRPFAGAILRAMLVALVAITPSVAAAQSSPQGIIGAWRADTPLPSGVVQTFRFDTDGTFDLSSALAVDGSYRIDGNQLIETVTLPSVGVTHTDTATFAIGGDSLIVNERTGAAPHILHRSRIALAASKAGSTAVPTIVGDWVILIGKGMEAHYAFTADGTMHVHAQVADEQGKYLVRADTLRLSNDQTFQLPATTQFAIVNDVLTLTPPTGKGPRSFHRVMSH
jgi:uncharacterized protein DUF5640